jgi:hypothetical protein
MRAYSSRTKREGIEPGASLEPLCRSTCNSNQWSEAFLFHEQESSYTQTGRTNQKAL